MINNLNVALTFDLEHHCLPLQPPVVHILLLQTYPILTSAKSKEKRTIKGERSTLCFDQRQMPIDLIDFIDRYYRLTWCILAIDSCLQIY